MRMQSRTDLVTEHQQEVAVKLPGAIYKEGKSCWKTFDLVDLPLGHQLFS